jgi:hypothetical protein
VRASRTARNLGRLRCFLKDLEEIVLTAARRASGAGEESGWRRWSGASQADRSAYSSMPSAVAGATRRPRGTCSPGGSPLLQPERTAATGGTKCDVVRVGLQWRRADDCYDCGGSSDRCEKSCCLLNGKRADTRKARKQTLVGDDAGRSVVIHRTNHEAHPCALSSLKGTGLD